MEVEENYAFEAKRGKSEIYFACCKNLTKFPDELLQNEKVKTIKLWSNRIKKIPSDISKLKNIEELYLSGNLLSELPDSFSKLQNLQKLYLGHNKFTEIPEVIFELKHLKELYLFNNKIRKISSKICQLEELQILDLENNEISEIPYEAHFLNLEKVNLNGNFLENLPIEIEDQGPNRILNYYSSLTEKVKLYEAKLLIVGNGGVGKTCLLKKTMNPKFKLDDLEATTEGIDIKSWFVEYDDIENFRINFWDFGGQEIYHSTHQFFLTKRSLYLFIWEARKEDNLVSFDYWLNIINLLSNNSPIIIVQNKIDERVKLIDEQTIIEKFPNIIDFFKVSVKTGNGIDDLREKIISEIVKLEHIGDVLPQKWVDIREKLENLGKNYITIEEYYIICSDYGLNKRQSGFLSQYFHDLGVFLHFSDNVFLNEIVFLKPDWATNAVYKIIDTKSVILNCGKFQFDELPEIWKDYPSKMYVLLIELMKKFELCFELPMNSGFIIPELLLARKPVFDWNPKDNLRFEYHYDFMPVGIITRFIVRVHDLILDDLYWKEGVVLERNKTKAIILNEQINRKIIVTINGENQNELLAIIRREIDFINNSLNNPFVREMIPCNCKVCKQNKTKTIFDYNELLIYQESNQKTIFCVKGKSRVKVDSLLSGFEKVEIDEKKNTNINIENIEISGGNATFSDTIINE